MKGVKNVAHMVTDGTCRVCGGNLPPSSGRGRPKTYCSVRCRRAVEQARARLPWARHELETWTRRAKQFGIPGDSRTAEQIVQEVAELEGLVPQSFT